MTNKYTVEQIAEARASLEQTAAAGGHPWLRWTDAEVCEHLDKWLPFEEPMREAGRLMAQRIDQRVYELLTTPPRGDG